MSAGDEVGPSATGDHDERFTRAFERAARLGIDIDEGADPLSDREAAAVRAFAALRADAAGPTDDAGAGPGAEAPAEAADPKSPPVAPGPEGTAPATDEGPLRPDAVLPSQGFARGSDWIDDTRSVSTQVIDLDVPPAGPGSTGTTATSPEPDWTGTTAAPPASHPERAAPASPPTGAAGPRRFAAAPSTPTAPPAVAGREAAGRGSGGETADPGAHRPAVPETSAFERPARAGDRHVLEVVGLGVASGAFVTPWVWLFVVIVAVLVGAALVSLASHGPRLGALAGRALRRTVGWLRPRSVVAIGGLVARAVLVALLVPGVVCAAWWVITEGTDGAWVAGRIGIWAHSLRLAAAVTCFVLVVGVGEARERRVARLRLVTRRFGTTAVTVAACCVVVGAVAVVALAPRSGGGRLAAADGLAWLPGRLRDNVDRVRDDVVSAELHASSGCLTDRQRLTWTVTYTTGNELRDDDVARLTAEERPPSAGEMATAAAALHNQLAPWIEGIEIRAGGATLVELDRSTLPRSRPVVDPTELLPAAGQGRGRLVDGAEGFDRSVALACAAAPIP